MTPPRFHGGQCWRCGRVILDTDYRGLTVVKSEHGLFSARHHIWLCARCGAWSLQEVGERQEARA